MTQTATSPATNPSLSDGRTAEGLTPYDLRISYELTNAIAAQFAPKPNLADMHAWIDFQWDAIRASALCVALINGEVNPGHARQLAVGRRLLDFVARCIEHEEQITTMFRAQAHNERRRR